VYDAVVLDHDGVILGRTPFDTLREAAWEAFERQGVSDPDLAHVDDIAVGVDPDPLGAGHENWAPYNVYRSADGRWVFVGPSSQVQWEQLCEALALDLHEDERFATLADRRDNEDSLDAALAATIAELDSAAVVKKLRDAGVPVAPVQKVPDVADDDHLLATDALGRIDTVEGEKTAVNVPKSPIRSSAFEPRSPSPPPALGADTEAVLRELGYSDSEIEALREGGAI